MEVICRLTGDDGNAFAIRGRVVAALRKAGKGEMVAPYQAKATNGDYNNLVAASMEVLDEAGIEWS